MSIRNEHRTSVVRTRHEGFTLVELLIVVAIIGILAAIAIPNLLTALQKSKQKRTMADMRSIAMAWESRSTDVNRYNAAAALALPTHGISFAQITPYLVPTYMKQLPDEDGWSHPYLLAADADWASSTAASNYMIRSYGADGATDTALGGVTTGFDCDIIFSNGTFLQWPEGVQQGH